jgi:hypothetical protein
MIKVQHWKLYSSDYNDDDIGIGFELKKINLNTNIMMEWEYLLPGKYSNNQGNQVITMTTHIYMKELLRRITDSLSQ